MASFRITILASAEDEIRNTPLPFRRQIVQAIHKLKHEPRPGNGEAVGGDLWRIRVHGYRVVYEIDDAVAVVTIFRVAAGG